MSHVTTVKLKITDLASLSAACKMLGLEFVAGQKTYRWYGKWMNDFHATEAAVTQGFDPATFGNCEHAIRLPGCAYEIGVVTAKDGGYAILYDNYGPGATIAAKLGTRCEKLAQRYAAIVAGKKLAARGLRVKEQVLANGHIRITAH